MLGVQGTAEWHWEVGQSTFVSHILGCNGVDVLLDLADVSACVVVVEAIVANEVVQLSIVAIVTGMVHKAEFAN